MKLNLFVDSVAEHQALIRAAFLFIAFSINFKNSSRIPPLNSERTPDRKANG